MSELLPQTVMSGGHEYRVGRLDVFDALQVARLIAPMAPVFFGSIIGKIGDLMKASKESEGASASEVFSEVATTLEACEPILWRLASMDRKSFESIVKTCLSCVERRDAKSFGRVMVDGNLMYGDIDLMTVIRLTITVVGREVRPIFAALGQLNDGAAGSSQTK